MFAMSFREAIWGMIGLKLLINVMVQALLIGIVPKFLSFGVFQGRIGSLEWGWRT